MPTIGLLRADRACRTVELRVAIGEYSAVGRDEPVATVVAGCRHADDWILRCFLHRRSRQHPRIGDVPSGIDLVVTDATYSRERHSQPRVQAVADTERGRTRSQSARREVHIDKNRQGSVGPRRHQ